MVFDNIKDDNSGKYVSFDNIIVRCACASTANAARGREADASFVHIDDGRLHFQYCVRSNKFRIVVMSETSTGSMIIPFTTATAFEKKKITSADGLRKAGKTTISMAAENGYGHVYTVKMISREDNEFLNVALTKAHEHMANSEVTQSSA
jgi:hypothetical protein